MKQLDPKSVWLFFVNSTYSWLFLIGIFSPVIAIPFLFFWVPAHGPVVITTQNVIAAIPAVWVVVLAVLVISWIWAQLSYHFYRYELRAEGFRMEFGVIWKRYVTIPYDKIQNVDIHRGVISRLLGLSDVNIQTAGLSLEASVGEGWMPGFSIGVAELLRDELIRRARQASRAKRSDATKRFR